MMQKLEELGPGTIGWLAGWLEGEGSFLIDKEGRIRIQASSTDKDTIDRLVSLIGGGTYPIQPKAANGGVRKPAWYWVLPGKPALNTMKLIYPLLSIRRQEQIKCVINNIKTEEDKFINRSKAQKLRRELERGTKSMSSM